MICNSEQCENTSYGEFRGSSFGIQLEHGKRALLDVVKPTEDFKRRKSSEEFPMIIVTDRSPASVLSGECTKSGEHDDSANEGCADMAWNNGSGLHSHSLIQHCYGDTVVSPAWTSSFPHCYEARILATGVDDSIDECGAPIFYSPWKKTVLIGTHHQAVIPEWRSRSSMKNEVSHDLANNSSDDVDGDSEKWISNTIMPGPKDLAGVPFPNMQLDLVCECPDELSIRCVRQHVMAAQNELKMHLGLTLFNELGLGEMGDSVALVWSDEEEELFNEIVYSNPASLGKNFWAELSLAFPGRSTHQIVSYYYNVFMLRKRAQQNRSESMCIDSDNDELQEIDEDTEGAEEDNTTMESPEERDLTVCNTAAEDIVVDRPDVDQFGEFFISGDSGNEQSFPLGHARNDVQDYMEDSNTCESSFSVAAPRLDGAESAANHHLGDQKCIRSFYGVDDFSRLDDANGSISVQFDPHGSDPSLIHVDRDSEILSPFNATNEINLLGKKDDFLIGHDISEFFID